MNRDSRKTIQLVVAAAALSVAGILCVLWPISALSHRNTILEIQELPLQTRLRLHGVVTYVDAPAKRFWIEDETGAVPIAADPASAHVRVGETVAIEATKTAPYDPVDGPASLGLQQIKIAHSAVRVMLPLPQPVALGDFPQADKNGIPIQLSGVVRAAGADAHGQAELIVATEGGAGTAGREIPVTVTFPETDLSKLIDAEVRVVGLPERTTDPQTGLRRQRMWVVSTASVGIEKAAPAQSALHSIRSLYLDEGATKGHRVRLRGMVTASRPGSVVVEDRWGSIDCELAKPQDVKVGSAVEVEGFSNWDSLRYDLVRAAIQPSQAGTAPDDSSLEGSALPAITTVREVRDLTPEKAALRLPVRLQGVITYADPIARQLFLQDASGGIYVRYSAPEPMTAETRATVIGITGPGGFGPVIVAPKVRVEGHAAFPTPIAASVGRASSGLLDAQFVSVEGVVHPVMAGHAGGHMIPAFELFTAFGRVHVYTSPYFPGLDFTRRFEDARVRIRGVLGTVFNARHQLVGYRLLVETPSQIEVIEPAVANPFEMPSTPIGNLLRFSPHVRYEHRVKVAGTVTLTGHDFFYLQDMTSGVEIRARANTLHVGQHVEAIGYPTLVGRYSPVMTDAAFRLAAGGSSVAPKPSTVRSILEGHQDSMLVTLEARLLMALDEPGRKSLVLQSGVRTFTAQLTTADGGSEVGHLREGSTVRVTGVCVAQMDPSTLYNLLDHDATDFLILMRSPGDVDVVHPAPFWTTRTTMFLLGGAVLLIPTILIWVAVLRRRVQIQTAALQKAEETAQAIKDLLLSMRSVSKENRFDTKVPVRGSEDVVQLVIGFNRMVAELEQREHEKRAAELKLQRMAMLDELTGLPNRRMLFNRLAQCLAAAERQNESLALLYIDLDGFKVINDNMGHSIGDRLLAEVAQRLKSRSRHSDTLARIGGDEFTLILDQIKCAEDADAAARNILDALSSPFSIEDHVIRIGASIGISIYPDHGSDCSLLLQQADCAMYAAKHNGKNRIVQFGDELGKTARQRMTLESELRRAVAEGAIHVHYQPEFDIVTNTIVRFEALARWTHKTLGNISPVNFIPIAEENGLINPLGAQILERACKDAMEWNRIANAAVQVAVNVSSVQLSRDSFVEEVEAILRRTGLSPALLQIELTESATMNGIERTAALISRLKSIGVSVVLDDFGTGYSCLSYLPRLPFDALKIDRSFVNELMVRPASVALAQSVVAMAHNLSMRVVVEGIETEEELEQIVIIGADEAQGYLLGRPSANPLTFLQHGAQNTKRAHKISSAAGSIH